MPASLHDDAATRADVASYYNEVRRFEQHVGRVVATLEKEGTLANTLILVMADNARAFPRAKTRLHDSRMKTYLIADWPAGLAQPCKPSASLVSAMDVAATVRQHAVSEHNWHDDEAHGRSVRSEGFLYLLNHRPLWPGRVRLTRCTPRRTRRFAPPVTPAPSRPRRPMFSSRHVPRENPTTRPPIRCM